MRILFITATYLPTTNGVTYHIQSTAKSLRELGHQVYILAPSFPGYKDIDKNVIRYPSLPNPFVKNYPVGIPLVLLGKIKKIKPDVIHTHHPLIIGQYATQLADKLKKPLFFTAHTQYEQYLNYYFPHGFDFTSKIIIRNLKKLSESCKKVICPSIKTKERLEKYGIYNTVVVYNGIESEFLNKPRDKRGEKPTLVYTGRIEKVKNLLFLIKVSQHLKMLLPNFRLMIIGSGTHLPALNQRIFKTNLGDNILITGEVSRKLLPDIYKSAHLFITASKTEVMPLSLLEALGSGLPIIALKNAGLEEIVKDGKTGFVLTENPKIVAAKINYLFSNPKYLQKLSLRAYESANNFSSKKTAEQLEISYLNN